MTSRFLVFILSSVLSFSLWAQNAEPEIVQGKLDNGLRYTLVPLHDTANRIDIRLRVNAGSVDEPNSKLVARTWWNT